MDNEKLNSELAALALQIETVRTSALRVFITGGGKDSDFAGWWHEFLVKAAGGEPEPAQDEKVEYLDVGPFTPR